MIWKLKKKLKKRKVESDLYIFRINVIKTILKYFIYFL